MASSEPPSFSGRPLLELVEALGLTASDLVEDLDTVKLRQNEQRLTTIEQGRGKKGEGEERLFAAGSKFVAARETYRRALSGFLKLTFTPPPNADRQVEDLAKGFEVPLEKVLPGADDFKDLCDTFAKVLNPRLFLHLELDKRTLVEAALRERGLAIPAEVRPALVMLPGTLARLFEQSLKKIEAWWEPGSPWKRVILAPEWQHTLNGRYLAVVGGDPVEGWRAASKEPAPGPPGKEDEALEPAEVYKACRSSLRWEESWIHHLTPLHLATEGDASPGDRVGDRLRVHLANLCLLFMADRTEWESDAWLCTFSESGEHAEVATVSPGRPLSKAGVEGVHALITLVRWAYSRYLTSDRLGFLQSRIARELRGSLPSGRYDLLLQQASGILGRIKPDWTMFMEGKVKEFSTQVKALEEDVAKTVESFSGQIAAMTKSLSDTMLGAVAVLLGAFIAALVKQELRLEILTVTVAIYVSYLLLFPLTYNMRERWESYRALLGQFEARRQRFEGGLSPDKVKQIVSDHVERSEHRFRRWFFLVAFTYLVIAGTLVQSINIAWWRRGRDAPPIDAVAFTARRALPFADTLEKNEALRTARLIGEDRLVGAEDVAVNAAGRLYTGTEDGRIVRVTLAPDGREIFEPQADTGGRPLGLRFGPAGRTLFVADAKKGLLAVDETGGIKPLATKAGGVPFGFTDDLDVAPDGTIYFSDASSRFGVDEYLYDLLEARPHGRLLRYDPKAKGDKVSVLLDGLYFANGVALASDQSYVLVNETYRYQIRRYWLKGPKAGTSDLFAKDLPGFPDNLSRDPATGRFWVALYTVRNPALDFLHPRPFLKNQLAKLPRFLWPKPEPYGLVLAIDEQGRVVESLHDPGGERVRTVTSAEPHGGKLYLGSLHGPMAVWEP